ncbi:DUF2797 domain-containing protein [Leptospira ognonensis]|nr:DUF2797 domain-containing protein [Leptospira ognonensis]
MFLQGYLRMMDHTGLDPVEYKWNYATYEDEALGKKPDKSASLEHESEESVNQWIGKKITLTSNGKIRCTNCGRPTKKSFGQGACYACFSTKAENDMCILRPETCHFHKGTCREPEWGKANCFKKHTVYFANSSGLKVGITKENPVSNRWVDQGARFGLPILEVDSRVAAGTIEHYLTKFLPDKTAWQKLVQGDPPYFDLVKEKEKYLKHLATKEFALETKDGKNIPLKWQPVISNEVSEISYPIQSYPKKIKSLKLSESEAIEDTLVGVKGQYLLFSSGVINIRSYGGYHFQLTVDN